MLSMSTCCYVQTVTLLAADTLRRVNPSLADFVLRRSQDINTPIVGDESNSYFSSVTLNIVAEKMKMKSAVCPGISSTDQCITDSTTDNHTERLSAHFERLDDYPGGTPKPGMSCVINFVNVFEEDVDPGMCVVDDIGIAFCRFWLPITCRLLTLVLALRGERYFSHALIAKRYPFRMPPPMVTGESRRGLFSTEYVRRMSVLCFGSNAVINGKSFVEFRALRGNKRLNIPYKFINPRCFLIYGFSIKLLTCVAALLAQNTFRSPSTHQLGLLMDFR